MAGNDATSSELFPGWSSVVHQPADDPEESELPSTVDITAFSTGLTVEHTNTPQLNANSESETDSEIDTSVSILFLILVQIILKFYFYSRILELMHHSQVVSLIHLILTVLLPAKSHLLEVQVHKNFL